MRERRPRTITSPHSGYLADIRKDGTKVVLWAFTLVAAGKTANGEGLQRE